MKRKLLILITLVAVTAAITFLLNADPNGVGDQNTNCIQCHYSTSGNASVQFDDIPETVAPGEQVTIRVGVNLDGVSGNIPGVMLLTNSNQIIQNGGWTIVQDPNHNSNPYNYNEAYNVSGNYVFTWILQAPNQPGTKYIKARLEYGHYGSGKNKETPIVTIQIAEAGDPEMIVTQGDAEIPVGGSYDFGTIEVGVTEQTIFVIGNQGDASLQLTENPCVQLSGSPKFFVIQQAESPIAPGETDNFKILFNGSTPGTFEGTVTIANNDDDENPYTFSISGTAQGVTHTITAGAGENGTIDPTGEVSVDDGQDQVFQMIPDEGYLVSDVLVDDVSMGALDSYTFTEVTEVHTIYAEFEIRTYTITAIAHENGTISPEGDNIVDHGSQATFTITANENYQIYDVRVDDISVGALSEYTFTDIADNHTIEALFEDTDVPYGEVTNTPSKIELFENYPNPFNPTTTIGFTIPQAQTVSLKIYDLSGELIRNLVDVQKGTGYHTVTWNGTDEHGQAVPSGSYIYRLTGEDFNQSKVMSLVK